MKQNSNVPAFLTKLWTLVEDSDTNEFICWSQEGNSFLVLDEQRFAKEILPKFFKHNNMASFVRQLNMYGFRKVMHIDTGIVKQERDGPVEFQHPFFKHGQDDLLENIKRKVSSARPEENKLRQEDLSKILLSVQNIHGKQENIDSRLATLKRENEALWREISDLRQKHTNQQQVIKKLIQFIITLVQNNRVLSLKRKRPLLMNSNGKKPKFIHQIFDEPVEHSKGSVNGINGLKNSSDISDDVIICDVTDEDTEITEETSQALDQTDVEIVEVHGVSDAEAAEGTVDLLRTGSEEPPKSTTDAPLTSSALQLNKSPALSLEDPVKMMDSILSENGAISQNINLLGKVELMDYLDSIDCSLEDFQAMLYGKHFIDPEVVEETDDLKENTEQPTKADKCEASNTDKQLIQYTTCPLLAFLDGCTPLAPESEAASSGLSEALLERPASDSTSLLEPSLEPVEPPPSTLIGLEPEEEEPPRSTLIRLEPLTEAEASEATLFYLCELNPETPSTETTPLEL
ncbi:heat shock factor protein 2 [Megalops cyprinoides]|uniref:heat shock factor protein 2 n=1 Tax=Megalops cyprinoides TaxID=118141 RepID=UPI0018644628|nr:heat shock factor protein 2 [Megalops cyprinoides]